MIRVRPGLRLPHDRLTLPAHQSPVAFSLYRRPRSKRNSTNFANVLQCPESAAVDVAIV